MGLLSKKVIMGCEAHGDADVPYLTRYYIFDTATWQLCIHVFHRSDVADLHDHPWWFLSLILWRGYTEVLPGNVRKRKWPGMLLYRPANWTHRVELLPTNKSAITLVLMGKITQPWGFFTKDGWQHFQKYFKEMGCNQEKDGDKLSPSSFPSI